MKSPLKKVQEKLWKECKRITLNKYGNTCFTCGASNLTGSNCQLGHFISSKISGGRLRYDLRNLRIQCMFCNLRLGGNGAFFYPKMVREVGQEKVDELFTIQANKKEDKLKLDFYENLLEEYTNL